jgi:hypothetical protein
VAQGVGPEFKPQHCKKIKKKKKRHWQAVVADIYNSSYLRGGGRRIKAQCTWAKAPNSYLKNKSIAKMSRDMSQVEKLEAQSSNTIT